MSQSGVERRSAPRKRVLKAAKIIFPSGGSVMDCMVRNISDTGTKLTLPSSVGVPETFTLLIEADWSAPIEVVRPLVWLLSLEDGRDGKAPEARGDRREATSGGRAD
ncbi:hypothetical protein, partial [Methylobacterium sp. WL103]|uniref:hypothetical protein n=1 Tax=Methylobacterium sp. WL103 TaxID=2603891 RepID=UPI001FF04CD5